MSLSTQYVFASMSIMLTANLVVKDNKNGAGVLMKISRQIQIANSKYKQQLMQWEAETVNMGEASNY